MSSEGLPVDGIVGTDIVLGTRSTQQATDEARGSLSADSAAQSADAAFKYSREAKAASADAKEAAKNVQNIADANTYYVTPEDPDGTIAGLAGTPNGKSFRVGQGVGNGFKTYVNKDGVALEVAGSLGANDLAVYVSHDTNDSIELSSDAVGNTITVSDEFGGTHIIGVHGSVQEKMESLDKNKGPYLNLLSDADNAAYGSIDEYGHLHLPDMQASIQDMLNSHKLKIDSIIKSRRVLDVRHCGFNAKTGENALNSIQRAVNWMSWQGGGVVYLPEGNYPLSSHITPKSNVSIIGAGLGRTILLPYKSNAAMRYIGNANAYLDDVFFSDFTIDGENQVLSPISGYIPDIKGMFFQYYSNAVLDKLEVTNIGASGIGLDFPDNCSITRCLVNNCGRLGTGDWNSDITSRPLGASGIGLGTGAKEFEPIFVSKNKCIANKNFGIFFEPQLSGSAKGGVATDNFCSGNFAGISDCGIEGLIVSSNNMVSNKYGYLLYPGTNNGGKPGRRALVTNNMICDNASHGIYSYSQKTDPLLGEYQFIGNKIRGNGEDGINHRYTYSQVKVSSVLITSNDIYENGRHGIHFEAGNIIINTDVTNNRIWANGKITAGDAINIKVPMQACTITGNKLRDVLQFNSEGQPAPTQQYPVYATKTMTDVDISFNHCVGNAQNSLNLTGTQTRVTTNFNAGI